MFYMQLLTGDEPIMLMVQLFKCNVCTTVKEIEIHKALLHKKKRIQHEKGKMT